jgi:low temperature requirement protein LtrA
MPVGKRSFARVRSSTENHRVTTFELFFDLVFVFAFTQVTEFMAHSHSALGVLQGLIILAILWWSWTSFSWLANQTRVDVGIARAGFTVALAGMFVIALVIPETFDDRPGGLYAPIVFVVCYFVIRVVHGLVYLLAAREDAGLRRQLYVNVWPMLIAVAMMVVGALIGGWAQTALWAASLILDFAWTYAVSIRGGWRVNSAAHWTERYGLIIILALGESVVEIGVGAAHNAVSVPVLLGGLLAILLSLGLWWLYFDIVAPAAEHLFAKQTGAERSALATDAFTYCHFLLIAGIIISALGVEQVLARIVSTEPFGWFGATALLGGTSLYLAGHAIFWRRMSKTWNSWRLAGGSVLLALIPAAAAVAPLLALTIVTAVVGTIAATETRRYAAIRSKVRMTDADADLSAETATDAD